MTSSVGLFGRFRALTSSAFRLAFALAIAFVLTGLVGAAGYWGWTYKERALAKQAEIAREWKRDLPNLQMVLTAKTKYSDGLMYVSAQFSGFPDFLTYRQNFDRGFNLRWQDIDGFNRVEKHVKFSELTTMLDEAGKKSALIVQFTQLATLDEYMKLAELNVGWNFDIEPAKPLFIPAPVQVKPQRSLEDPADADHCAPGISREERLRRLAAHGRVRETGLGEYTAGSRQINILSSGQLLSCR